MSEEKNLITSDGELNNSDIEVLNIEQPISEFNNEQQVPQQEPTVIPENISVEPNNTYQTEVDNNPNNPTEFLENHKPKKKLFGLTLLGVLLAVIIILVLGYFLIFNKPKNIFLRAINNEYKNIAEIFKSKSNDWFINSNGESILSESNIDFNFSISDAVMNEYSEEDGALIRDVLKDLNGLNYKVVNSIDYKNKEIVSQLSLNQSTTTLLGLNIYAVQERIYLELKNLFDKIIEFPEFDYDILFEENDTSLEDIEYVLEQLKNSFLNNLMDEDFTSSNAELEIDGKIVKAKKVTYEINGKTVITLVTNMLNELKDNDKFIDTLVKISNQERSVINNSINSMLEAIKLNENTTKESSQIIYLSVYTKGLMNEAIAYEMTDKDNYGEEITRFVKGDKSLFTVIYNNEEVFNASIEFPSDNLVKIIAKEETSEFTLNIEYKDNECNINYTFSESDMKFYGKISLKSEEVTKDKVYNTNLAFELAFDIEGFEEFVKLDYSINSKTEIGKSLEIPEISNKISLEEITDADLEQIMTKLLETEFFQKYIVTRTEDNYSDTY